MKSASAGLIALLNSNRNFIVCDLYTITLIDNTVIRLTSSDINIKYDGNTYYTSPRVKRDNLSFEVGITVDSINITIYPQSSDLINTVSWQEAFRNGTFDGATLQIDKAFFTSWDVEPLVLEKLFLGKLDVEDLSRSEIKLDVKSVTEILNISIPKGVYQANCPWVLYETNTCKATKVTNSGLITSTSTKTVINCNLAQINGYFDQGVITFNSGLNNNVSRAVKSYSVGVITLVTPLPYTPSIGDSFNVFRGCNRTTTDCTDKFSNIVNFGGFPYTPNTESVYTLLLVGIMLFFTINSLFLKC